MQARQEQARAMAAQQGRAGPSVQTRTPRPAPGQRPAQPSRQAK